jgi:hypothetical protein
MNLIADRLRTNLPEDGEPLCCYKIEYSHYFGHSGSSLTALNRVVRSLYYMSQTARPSEAPFALHESYRNKIEKEAEQLGLDTEHLVDVVIEEGLQSIRESKNQR